MALKCKINGETLTLTFVCIGQIFQSYHFKMISANDPRCGPQMIPPENKEWHGVSFHVYIFSFYFHHPNDKCKEKILTT